MDVQKSFFVKKSFPRPLLSSSLFPQTMIRLELVRVTLGESPILGLGMRICLETPVTSVEGFSLNNNLF